MEATISELVRELESDLMDDRKAAATKLLRLGHAALSSLRRRSLEAPPALQKELGVVIESIRYTDFLLMVRPEPWQTTSTLAEVGIEEAHRELFGRKPLHPPLDVFLLPVRGEWAKIRSSFTFKNETYWKTVIAFSKAYSVDLDFFGGERARFEGLGGIRWSEPHGPCIVCAEVKGNDKRLEVTIGLHLEPGFQPIQGSIRKLSVQTSEGALQPAKVEEGREADLTGDRTIPTACEYMFPLSAEKGFISISGTARVLLPTKVEGISWTVDEWKSQPTKELAGCQVTLKDWELGMTFKPTIEVNPDPKRDYAGRAWVILSDDAGRTSNNRAFGLFGKGYGESGGSSGWSNDDPTYRRVCVIRPMDADVIEFQFEIKDIPLPKKRND